MTRAWRLLVFATLFLLLLSLLARSGLLLAAALPYLVLCLMPLFTGLPAVRLKVKRTMETEQMTEAGECVARMHVTNEGDSCPDLLIMEPLPAGLEAKGECFFRGALPAGGAVEREYAIQGSRGFYHLSGAVVRSSDLLGFRMGEQFIPLEGALAVWPDVEPLGRIAITPRRTHAFVGDVRSRESGAGLEFFGTRPYVSGDPPRHMNWKAGARWDSLIANLFQQDRVAEVAIVLDGRVCADVRGPSGSLFEHTVRATASLASRFLDRGNSVALLVYGSFLSWIAPGYGKRQRVRILNALARAELGDHVAFEHLENLPARVLPLHAQLVLVSPLLDRDVVPIRHLCAMGYNLLVVSPDWVSFEESLLPRDGYRDAAARVARLQRDACIAWLRRVGVRVIRWDVAMPLGNAFQRPRGPISQ